MNIYIYLSHQNFRVVISNPHCTKETEAGGAQQLRILPEVWFCAAAAQDKNDSGGLVQIFPRPEPCRKETHSRSGQNTPVGASCEKQFAMENCPFVDDYLLNMVIFHSYIKLAESTPTNSYTKQAKLGLCFLPQSSTVFWDLSAASKGACSG